MALYETESELEEELAQEFELRSPQVRPSAAYLREQIRRHGQAHARLRQAVQAMKKHVVKRGQTYHFTLPAQTTAEAASKLGLGHSTFVTLHRALKAGNHHLRTRPAVRESEFDVGGALLSEFEWEAESCAGITTVKSRWWGTRTWLNECDTKSLIAFLKGGGALGTGICAIIAKHPACAGFGIIAGGGFAIEAIDDLGSNNGIVISQPWVGPPIVWHQ